MLARLRALAGPSRLPGMARYGIATETRPRRDRRRAARPSREELGRDHDLAAGCGTSGVHEARILASLVDDPALVDDAQFERWAADFDSWDLCDQVCQNLFRHARRLDEGRRVDDRRERGQRCRLSSEGGPAAVTLATGRPLPCATGSRLGDARVRHALPGRRPAGATTTGRSSAGRSAAALRAVGTRRRSASSASAARSRARARPPARRRDVRAAPRGPDRRTHCADRAGTAPDEPRPASGR